MRVVVFVIAALACASCAEVKPWQRGALTHASMEPEDRPTTLSREFLSHVFDVREGSKGAGGQAGGGCGCN